jgi:hypothetical protein
MEKKEKEIDENEVPEEEEEICGEIEEQGN